MAAAQRFADGATPEPELEPHGFRSNTYGFFVCPPRALQPLDDLVERKLAHSLRFVLPRMTAPASRSFFAMKASWARLAPTSASDPAVVIMRSAVSILSLIRIGMPCSGPRTPRSFRSRSSAEAIDSASGFSSITDRSVGPFLSMSLMRSVYFSTRALEVYLPD